MKKKLSILLLTCIMSITVFAQWKKTNFPSIQFGQSYCIIENANKFYVGTNDGVYFSPDKGTTWSKISKAETKLNNVRTIVTKGVSVFVGTLDNGVFMSSDNKTWKQISKGFLSLNVRSMFFKDKNMFVCTEKGIYSTDNNGVTWKEIITGITEINYTYLALGANGLYLNTFANGVYHSNDNGNTWLAINGQLERTELMGNKILVCDSCIIYTNKAGDIYISRDNGKSWKNFAADLQANVRALYLNNGTIYLGGSRGEIFYSKDNGKSWKQNDINTGGMYGGAGSSTTGILVSGDNLYTCQESGQLLWMNTLSEFR
jgi:photosystem II stability/assembly factor-like uncharacterized protein